MLECEKVPGDNDASQRHMALMHMADVCSKVISWLCSLCTGLSGEAISWTLQFTCKAVTLMKQHHFMSYSEYCYILADIWIFMCRKISPCARLLNWNVRSKGVGAESHGVSLCRKIMLWKSNFFSLSTSSTSSFLTFPKNNWHAVGLGSKPLAGKSDALNLLYMNKNSRHFLPVIIHNCVIQCLCFDSSVQYNKHTARVLINTLDTS